MPTRVYTKSSPSGKVTYAITNVVAFMDKESVSEDFHPLMDFLNNSPISYALTASPPIYAEIVQEMWGTADCSSARGGIKFTIKGNSYIITPSVINEALHFPESNFENLPTKGMIFSMLKAINYVRDPWSSSRILKKNFRKEWSYFFDTLNKCFAGKYGSYNIINTFVLKIAYSLLYGKRIDIGKLLLDEFSYKFGAVQDRDHIIYFARFLMIIANYLCKDICVEDRNDTLQVHMQGKKLFAGLVIKNHNAEVKFVLPEHVQVQLSTLYPTLSHTNSLLLPPTMEDVRDGYASPTQVMPPADATDGIPAVEVPSSQVEKPVRDPQLVPAQDLDDRQHLLKAASVLKSQLVVRLTRYAESLSAEDMVLLANKCYNTIEGLGDNYTSFRTEVNKLIAQHQELAIAAKNKDDWNEGDMRARYAHKLQSLSDVRQKLSCAKDKLLRAETHANSIKLKKEELTGASLKLTEKLHEVEERIKTLTQEKDQFKDAHSVAEAELGKLDVKKGEACVAFNGIDELYNAAKKEFEKIKNHLLLLVQK